MRTKIQNTDSFSLIDNPADALYCDVSEYPYSPDTLPALIDREATIRAQWITDRHCERDKLIDKDKYSEYKPTRFLITDYLPQALEGVMAYLNRLDTNSATVDKKNIELLSTMPWMKFTLIAFTNMVDSAIAHRKAAAVIERIADACEMEVRWEHYAEREKFFFDTILEQQHKHGKNTEHINNVLTLAMNRRAEGKYKNKDGKYVKDPALAWKNWPKGAASYGRWLGATLLNIIIQTTELFKLENDTYTPSHRGTDKFIVPTNAFRNYIDKAEHAIGLYGGYYLPIPVPPRDWTTTQNGGYWTRYGGQKKLIKNWSRGYQEEMLGMTEQLSKIVFPAINAAQHTAWRINRPILDVIQELSRSKHAIAGLPPVENPELPVCPVCGQAPETGHACFKDPNQSKKDKYANKLIKGGLRPSEARQKADTEYGPNRNPNLVQWKKAAHDVYCELNKLDSHRLSLHYGLEVAELLANDERFYYVYQTDFRGRLYPLGILNPQGTDWQKGLLQFADGVELGEHGAKWLAVHIANTWGNDGLDKKSYADRVNWVEMHESIILNCAANPLDCLDWTEAEEPFCFLAACMEWAGYKAEGTSYKSRVAVALDGSCSGIQHYSAMLRDEVGALATNVKCVDPDAGKNDIYTEVANMVTHLMTQHSADADTGYCATWILAHKLIDRKIVKRAVMTLPYGSTYASCDHYVGEAIRDKLKTSGITDDEQLKIFMRYTVKTVWAAIPMVVKAAREGMDYLKTLARLFTGIKLPITWTTPTGFIVQQSYYSVEGQKIRLQTGGSVVLKNGIPIWQHGEHNGRETVTFQSTDAREIDPTRQVSGIAPNFIHSLDASHLMMSVQDAHSQGIEHFALIHDSLGVHAGLTETFSNIIRDNFYKLYAEHDPLGDITTHLLSQLDTEVVKKKALEKPLIGTLSLEEIKKAVYLFA